jgi:hypothetical protein
MQVIAHQAEGMNPAAELLDSVLDDEIEAIPVPVIEKDRIAGIATQDDVIQCGREMYALPTSHGGSVSTNVQMSNLTPIAPLSFFVNRIQKLQKLVPEERTYDCEWTGN